VTWATSVPISVFLGLSVLELGPVYATDRRQTKASLNAPHLLGAGHNNGISIAPCGRNTGRRMVVARSSFSQIEVEPQF